MTSSPGKLSDVVINITSVGTLDVCRSITAPPLTPLSLCSAAVSPSSSSTRHEYQLCHVDETPHYLKCPHIYSGYRVHFSFDLCRASLWRLHNETVIWPQSINHLHQHLGLDLVPNCG